MFTVQTLPDDRGTVRGAARRTRICRFWRSDPGRLARAVTARAGQSSPYPGSTVSGGRPSSSATCSTTTSCTRRRALVAALGADLDRAPVDTTRRGMALARARSCRPGAPARRSSPVARPLPAGAHRGRGNRCRRAAASAARAAPRSPAPDPRRPRPGWRRAAPAEARRARACPVPWRSRRRGPRPPRRGRYWVVHHWRSVVLAGPLVGGARGPVSRASPAVPRLSRESGRSCPITAAVPELRGSGPSRTIWAKYQHDYVSLLDHAASGT